MSVLAVFVGEAVARSLGASRRALLIRHADGTLQAHPEPHTRLAEGDAVILFADPAP